eukprot:m.272814 g.272814  ORF g.272814 m.272814 type:complete len:362 (-) comp16113_c1_seq1:2564-3649(-)
MSAAGYVRASAAICTFFFKNLSNLRRLERLTDNVNAKLATRCDTFVIEEDRDYVRQYNDDLAALRQTVKREVPPTSVFPSEFLSSVLLFFGIRALCICTALWSDTPVMATFAASLLQFVVLPFSLHVAFLHLLVLALPLFGPHYAAVGILHMLVPEWASVHVEIGLAFVATFVLIDQFLCLLLCFETPKGKAKHKDGSTLLLHGLYGFFNCKTYTVILLLVLRGFRVNLTVWLLDVVLGLTNKLSALSGQHLCLLAAFFLHVMILTPLAISRSLGNYLLSPAPRGAHSSRVQPGTQVSPLPSRHDRVRRTYLWRWGTGRMVEPLLRGWNGVEIRVVPSCTRLPDHDAVLFIKNRTHSHRKW